MNKPLGGGTWEQDGGALMNQCIHNIDLFRWMMGDEVTEVIAYTDRLNHDYIEAEDLGIALVKFKKWGLWHYRRHHQCLPCQSGRDSVYLWRKGTVKAGGHSVNIIEEWIFADQIDDPETVKAPVSRKPAQISMASDTTH